MSNNIIPFPKQNAKKIQLFDDEEIFVTIAAINVFGAELFGLANPSNLHEYDPDFVVSCLRQFKESGILSNRAKVICKRIMDSYCE